MSFQVTLYQNLSDNRVLTKNIVNSLEVSGTLRNECSVVTPVIQIQTTQNLSTYNYCYIPEFHRYYYINEIRSIVNGVFEISLKCDVLMTYKQGILASRGVVSRQQNNVNLYLDDPKLPIYSNTFTVTKNFPSGLTGESYVLVVAG